MMISKVLLLSCVLLSGQIIPTFYVAPDGNDSWSGQRPSPNADATDGPFATIQQALDQVSRLRGQSTLYQGPVTIEVLGGVYHIKSPIIFRPVHSRIRLRAYQSERPVISGGIRITNWRLEDGRWVAYIPQVAQGQWYFTQLFVNHQRRFRPSLPQKGYYQIKEALEPTEGSTNRGDDRFRYEAGQFQANWANLQDVEVLVFLNWNMCRLPIRDIDPDNRIVRFFGHSPSSSWWGRFKQGSRFRIENVKESLSRPGQWYIDRRKGQLTYIPFPGEQPDQTEVVAPYLERLVVFEGDYTKDQIVRDVVIEGLTFAHTQWRHRATGQAVPQAEVNLDGAISIEGARDITIRRCAVIHTGGYGIAFGAGCHDNTVEDCELVDLGAGGIKIGATGLDDWTSLTKAARSDAPLTSNHLVRNCTIAHGGRIHPAAVGVWIGHSPYNRIEHNEIHDFYYTGISVGWVWGYGSSHAHHNRIEFNHIYNIGQGVLSDMGGVYTLGPSPGTLVRYNHIHDVQSFDYGGWGLYTDEGSTGITMAYNLVYRTKTGGFHQHYGRDNWIFNNIFAFSTTDQLQRTRVEQHISFVFERNIVIYKQGQLMGKNWTDKNVILDHNIYWNLNGPVLFPEGLDLANWQASKGHDMHSLVIDPGFLDAVNGDYRLRADSPALRIGFSPFDYSKAGRLDQPILTRDLPPVPAAFD